MALAAAVLGVYLLTDVRLVTAPLGFLLAAVNAVLFAGLHRPGHQVARNEQLAAIDGLALSMLIAAVIALPIGVVQAAPALGSITELAAAVGVGISSPVIPYVCDQLAVRRLPRATSALMVSLLPATATVIGIVVLTQVPSVVEILAVLLVILGVAIHHDPPSAVVEERGVLLPDAHGVARVALDEAATGARDQLDSSAEGDRRPARDRGGRARPGCR